MEMDLQETPPGPSPDLDLRLEPAGELLRRRRGVDLDRPGGFFLLLLLRRGLAFEIAGGEPFADGAFGEEDLLLGSGEREKRAGLPHRELSSPEQILDLFGEAEEAERIGDGGPRLADADGDLFLLESKLLLESKVGLRLLQRVEV